MGTAFLKSRFLIHNHIYYYSFYIVTAFI
jgi:hypothetical protein